MSIINFTVEYDLLASLTDSADMGADADVVPLTGTITFTPVLSDTRAVLAPGYDPRPAGFKIRPFVGVVDTDGQLKASKGGAVGVRLWANDPVLELDQLTYRVSFDVSTTLGQKVPIEDGFFEALSTDGTLNLADVLTSTGSPSIGNNTQPVIYAHEIVDSTNVGIALMTADDEAAARAAIDACLVSIGSETVDSFDVDTTPMTASDVGAYSRSEVDDAIEAAKSEPVLNNPVISNIYDSNGNVMLSMSPTASATNYVKLTNRAGSTPPTIEAAGSGSDISLILAAKGSSSVQIYAPTGEVPTLQAAGPDASHSLLIAAKGSSGSINLTTGSSGVVQVNGVALSRVSDPDAIAVGQSTMRRRNINSTGVASTNGYVRLSYFTATASETITQLRLNTGSTAAAGATLARAGIYSVNASTGDLTLVASIPDDMGAGQAQTLWTTANAAYTRTLSASYGLVAGTRYAVGLIVTGTSTAPTFIGYSGSAAENAIAPRISGFITGQTDLPATITAASLSDTGVVSYVALLP